MVKRRVVVMAAASAAVVVAVGNVRAEASPSGALVTYTSSAPPALGGRTLSLYNNQGTSLSTLDLSQGANSFEAVVTDSNYDNYGFNVTATMSNLYGYSDGNYNCSQMIPSSDVYLASPTSLLDVGGVSDSAIPTLTLSGNIGSALGSTILTALGISSGAANITNLATTTTDEAYNQSQLDGGVAGSLIGSAVTTADSSLPIAITAPNNVSGTAFANPAADPTGANCNVSGSDATPVAVESGSDDLTGMTSDVTGVVNGLASPTTALTLANDGWISESSVISGVESALHIPAGLLNSTIDNNIMSALLPTVTGNSSIEVNGSYAATPSMWISSSSTIPGGAYQGQLTVTLADTGS